MIKIKNNSLLKISKDIFTLNLYSSNFDIINIISEGEERVFVQKDNKFISPEFTFSKQCGSFYIKFKSNFISKINEIVVENKII
jgi:hypothetical protein